jgi:hypothetical protein
MNDAANSPSRLKAGTTYERHRAPPLICYRSPDTVETYPRARIGEVLCESVSRLTENR